jgi:type I restriction enzyme R subunit
LEALRDKAEQGLITSIEFVKELCKIAKETLKENMRLNYLFKNYCFQRG